MSEDLVDTWPDWKLDTLSLRERSIRRERGEMLPKPTQQAKQLSDALSELKRLREENAALREDRDRFSYLLDQLSPSMFADHGTYNLKQVALAMRGAGSGNQATAGRAAIDAARTTERGGN